MPRGDPLPVVREAVREILTASPAFAELDSDRRRELAHSMVQVCHVAASLIQEEVESDQQARTAAAMETEARATAPRGVARAIARFRHFLFRHKPADLIMADANRGRLYSPDSCTYYRE